MAVKKVKFTETEGTITISNGDFQALKKIAKEYHISDETDVITFAIGVLSEAAGKPVSVEKTDGTLAKFIPSDKLRAVK